MGYICKDQKFCFFSLVLKSIVLMMSLISALQGVQFSDLYFDFFPYQFTVKDPFHKSTIGQSHRDIVLYFSQILLD